MFYPADNTEPYPDCPGRNWQCVPVSVQQVGDRWFKLTDGFDWRASEGSQLIQVRPHKVKATDLASIPFFLRWFAAGYGRHTPAALLHDQLRRCQESDRVTREDSDRVFLQAMKDVGVPSIRRLILWTAVVGAGRVLARQTPGEDRTLLALTRAGLTLLWLAILVVMWLWVAGLFELSLPEQIAAPPARSLGAVLIVALAAPIALGLLWEREFGAGVVAGWAIPVFLPFGMIGTFITFVIYGVIEFIWVILIMTPRFVWFGIRWILSRLGIGSKPRPPQPVPGPTPWGGVLERWLGAVLKVIRT